MFLWLSPLSGAPSALSLPSTLKAHFFVYSSSKRCQMAAWPGPELWLCCKKAGTSFMIAENWEQKTPNSLNRQGWRTEVLAHFRHRAARGMPGASQ